MTPTLGNVNALVPIEASPPDLKDDMCGPHRKRRALEQAIEESDDDADLGDNSDSTPPEAGPRPSGTALRVPVPKNLLSEPGPVIPVVVYTGPTKTAEQIAALATLPGYEGVPR